MKYLSYGSTWILVSDAAAFAVVDYTAVLAQIGRADVVVVPTTDCDGALAQASVVLGAGITVRAISAPDDELEEDAHDFVDEIASRIELAVAQWPRRRPSG